MEFTEEVIEELLALGELLTSQPVKQDVVVILYGNSTSSLEQITINPTITTPICLKGRLFRGIMNRNSYDC